MHRGRLTGPEQQPIPNLIEGGGIFVLVDRPRHAELAVGHHVVLLAPVDDLLEVDGHLGELDVGVGAAAVDHRGQLGGSGLRVY